MSQEEKAFVVSLTLSLFGFLLSAWLYILIVWDTAVSGKNVLEAIWFGRLNVLGIDQKAAISVLLTVQE